MPAGVERPTPARLRLVAAIALAMLFTLAWTIRDWASLSAFRLPDNDDMARLAQVRDWLDGQAFADLVQHRLGPPGGASMHWSRLADMGPAAIVLLLQPVAGRELAETLMLSLYPGMLFVVAIAIAASIAERLARGTGLVAAVIAALAFPAASLFVPGRIDHHGLQIVLMLALARALVAPPGWRSGLAAGAAAATSLAIGLETLPIVLFGMAAIAWRWLGFMRSGDRTGITYATFGFAIALGGATLLFLATLRPMLWPREWCDGLTPASTAATLIAAAAFAALGFGGRWVSDWPARLALAIITGIIALPIVYATSSVCLTGPYGALDPVLQRLWMGKVGEALGLVQQDSFGVSVSYGAFGFVGLAALGLLLRRRWRRDEWQVFAILYTPTVLLTLAQVRVTYVASALAAVPVAIAVVNVRRRTASPLPRIAAWIVGAGLTWNLAGLYLDRMFAPAIVAAKVRNASCTGPEQVTMLSRLPTGRVAAPLDSAAYVLGATRHSVIAAPYHRNNAGNLALYRLYLGTPERARTIAADWRIDYLVLCRDSFGELGAMALDRRRLIGRLTTGKPPAWLEPIATASDGPLIFRNRDLLSKRPAPR